MRILAALEYMRKNGWNKGSSYGPQGEACIAIALAIVFGKNIGRERDNDNYAINRVIREQYGHISGDGFIPNFNDHPSITFADVEKVMEKAAIARGESLA